MELWALLFRTNTDRVKTFLLVIGAVCMIVGVVSHLPFIMGLGAGGLIVGSLYMLLKAFRSISERRAQER